MLQGMRIFSALISLLIAIVPAMAAEKIEFGVGEYRLQAELYRPSGAGPFPTIVAMHGCGGLMDSTGKIRPQYADWGERLAAQGLAVMFPDSYASRGLGSNAASAAVRSGPRANALPMRMRRAPGCRRRTGRERIASALLGWSNGAIAVLWTVRPRAAPKDEPAGFPLGGRAVSGLPPPRRERMERTRSDADPDRRRGQLDAGARLRTNGGRRARAFGTRGHRQVSRRASRFRSRKCRRGPNCAALAFTPGRLRPRLDRRQRRKRAPTRSSACRNGSRAKNLEQTTLA